MMTLFLRAAPYLFLVAVLGLALWSAYERGADKERLEAEARELRLEVATTQAQMDAYKADIERYQQAAREDTFRAIEAAAEEAALKEKIDALLKGLSDRACLDGPASDRLRDLWGPDAQGGAVSPSPSAPHPG